MELYDQTGENVNLFLSEPLTAISWPEGSGNGLYISAQLGLQATLFDLFSVSLGGSYSFKNPQRRENLRSFGAFLSASLHIHGAARETITTPFLPPEIFSLYTAYRVTESNGQEVRERVEVDPGKILGFTNVELDSLFPVLHKYYEENSFGNAIIINNTGAPVKNVEVSFYVEEYMNDPWPSAIIDEISHQEEVVVDLYALFQSGILAITEPTKVSAKAIVEYDAGNERISIESVEPFTLHRRNAITWDDDRKAAAYITSGDPAILKFSNNISAWIRDVPTGRLSDKFVKAMAIHEALVMFGLAYTIDPAAPYNGDEAIVDFPKFPIETLNYSAGDCDDLSILYCSLLESVGIETAFITTPAHIEMAFKLDISSDDAANQFLETNNLIFRDQETWVPVEATLVTGSFIEAWREGAKQWRRYSQTEQAAFFPNHASWREYTPVQLPPELVSHITIEMPDRDRYVDLFSDRITRFVDQQLYPQVAELEAQIEDRNGDPRYINRLAILYARYGLYDKSMAEFDRILADNEFYPALVNKGNIYYMQENNREALAYYERAFALRPDSTTVLLGLAQAHSELENYGTSRDYYARLREIDAQIADQYSHLGLGSDSRTRAAVSADRVEWEDSDERSANDQ